MTDVPFTRDSFIADDHVQVAISNLKTIWSEDQGGPLKEIPMPPSIKESGILPDGYCVDFAHDPITMVHALASTGIIYESQLEKNVIDEMKDIVNAPGNLAIVPIHVRDSKLQSTIEALGPLKPPNDENKASTEDDSDK